MTCYVQIPPTSPASRNRQSSPRAKRPSIKVRRAQERAQARLRHPALKLSIEHLPISDIRVYGRRLRKPAKGLQEKLEASIGAFGLVLPLLVDREGVLIDGHALLRRCQGAGPSQRCRWSGPPIFTEAEVKALRLALNRLPALNTWDGAELALEFKELIELDLTLDLYFDLTITGFSPPEIDQLIERSSSRGETDRRLRPDMVDPRRLQAGRSLVFGGSPPDLRRCPGSKTYRALMRRRAGRDGHL